MNIRNALPSDVPQIVRFIGELAEFEKLAHQVRAREADLARHLFTDPPACWVLMAEVDGEACGFALYFSTYSSFETAECMHLEDLYVAPRMRGRGVGQALLRGVAAAAQERGCPRLQWCVLDWNRDAIGFYEKLGAELLGDWRVCRLDGDGIARFAARGSGSERKQA